MASRRFSLILLAAFLALPFIYFFLYAPYGYSDTDEGFIQGLCWRMLNGETVYTDFDYVRPPVTLWLHTLEMSVLPDVGEVLWSRLVYYLQTWASVAFALAALLRFFPDWKPLAGLLGIAIFLVECHNAPPMPWHTTDGIFFASMGIFLLSRGSEIFWLAPGLLALLLAAGCKQSFYLMPLAGLVFVYFFHGRQSFARACFLMGLLILTIVGIVWGAYPQWARAMMVQTTFHTAGADFISQGFLAYAKPATAIALVPGIVAWLPSRIAWAQAMKKWAWLAVAALVLGLFTLNVVQSQREAAYVGPSFGWAQVLFLAALSVVILMPSLPGQGRALLAVLLFLTWCGGISWGYAIPLRNFAPVLFALSLVAETCLSVRSLKTSLAVCIILFFFGFHLQLHFPYRDSARTEMAAIGDNRFEVLKGIKTGPGNRSRLQEMASLASRYPSFAVMPAMPQAHYLLRARNPFRWEWEHNAEIALPEGEEGKRMLHPDSGQAMAVLVQRDHAVEWNREGKFGTWVTRWVREHWTKVEETPYFEVYFRGNPHP